MCTTDLVSVVIPAYNASGTIDETIRSVRSQTHTNLEILIVDDGSHDNTADIVLRHATADSRVHLLRQRNLGVAAARNRGIEESRAEFIAPVDADDLWRRRKIEKQLAALHEGGHEVALVYNWYAVIDPNSRIIDETYRPQKAGRVLRCMCGGNLVGNGSSALIRKAAILEAGGYDSSLRARGAGGCEDLQLYFRIAERHLFALVPECLTGYRQTRTNMSSDVLQMLRSWEIVAEEMSSRCPEYLAEIAIARESMMRRLLSRAVSNRSAIQALHLAIHLACHNPRGAVATAVIEPAWQIVKAVAKRAGNLTGALLGRDNVCQRVQFDVEFPVCEDPIRDGGSSTVGPL
jgi:hypothetical protein